jgi:polyvinyl alcohol dehydrogenase (cytochrome)
MKKQGFARAARLGAWLAGLAAMAAFAGAAHAAPSGQTLYEVRCKSCHESVASHAPSRAALRVRPKAEIVKALTEGSMATMTLGMSPDDIGAIADYLTGAGGDAGRATISPVDAPCATRPPITPGAADWLSAGGSPVNHRFQAHPAFAAADVGRLKVKWAFSISHANSQPVVVGDWLWIAGSGKVYALDARTGCVHWAAAGISSRPTPAPVKTAASPSGWALIVGQRDRVVTALDAATGKAIWASQVLETHPAAGITGSPVVAGGRVFVPISSLEEGSSASPAYPCCSFRGSVAALDLATGKTLWKSHTITEPMRPLGKNSAGTPLQGPAGAAVWSAPTVDLKRGLVYVATGDSYTDADTKGADAVQAFDIATGARRWVSQAQAGDNFVIGCFQGGPTEANCPKHEGPDYDFGSSPILMTLKGGREVLLAGQKSGFAYGLDPASGKVLWKTPVGAGSALGGIEWGMAADGRRLYAPVSDIIPMMVPEMRKLGPFMPLYKGGPAKPGLSAVDPATGKVLWRVPTPKDPCAYRSPSLPAPLCFAANSGAPAAMPGVVFAGSTDGFLRAYDAATGKVVWKADTAAQRYDTANGVKGQPGGGLDGNGPSIAGPGLFVTSGWDGASSYGDTGTGYNVLLAFTVDGK